jgi:hypothetical protein
LFVGKHLQREASIVIEEEELDASAIARVYDHFHLIQEMFFCRSIDSFLTYVSDLLRAVLHAKPDILSGTEKIRTERLLKAKSIEELVAEVIEEQVSSLSYAGFRELSGWLEKRGIALCSVEADKDRLSDAIAMRNVFIHNRGRVDSRFLAVARTGQYMVGQQLVVEFEQVTELIYLLATTAVYADGRAAQKFGIPAAPYGARA